MKQVQISEKLFMLLIRFHLGEDYELNEEIKGMIESKLDAIISRNIYTTYKTAPTEEEREKARQNYLDRKGYNADWRW